MRAIVTQSPAGSLQVWDHPQEERQYVVGCDVAEGKVKDLGLQSRRRSVVSHTERPDYSCAMVIEMETGLHVASWHGYMPPDEFAMVVCAIGMYYNDALLVVELNGPGLAVVTRLNDTLRYQNMYRARLLNAYSMQDPATLPVGWQTTKYNRHVLIDHISEAINTNNMFTRDRGLISELRTMEVDPATGTPRARGRNKDDRVMAFALALEGRHVSMGHGFSAATGGERLSGFDAQVWRHVKQQQEASSGRRSARNGILGGSYLQRPPRPVG